MFVIAVTAFVGRDRLVEEWYIQKLDLPDFSERFRAALKLGEMRSARAVPHLVALLKQLKNDDLYRGAAIAAWNIPADFVAGDLLAHVLTEIGPPAVPALIGALGDDVSNDEGHRWRSYACRVLGNLRVNESVPILIEVLGDADPMVRLSACNSLGRIGPAAEAALPALQSVRKDRWVSIDSASKNAIKKIRALE